MSKPWVKVFPVLILFFIGNIVYAQKSDNRIFGDTLIKVSNISINSIHSDFGPCVINDSLYFTTFNDKLIKSSDLQLRKKEFYDLYKTKVDKEGNPVSEREPVDAFITKFNDGPVSWCKKTNELFITQNDPELRVKTKGFQPELVRLKIVIAKQVNGKWGALIDFPYNSSKYSVGHPAINETGDTLIFTSDIPGGFGETDLYYSVRKNGKWGIPVNLGPQINTSGKDEFPFLTDLHLNGRFLIFSSNGRFGSGGFDLYYTRFSDAPKEINHFDTPINTPYDDFAMNIPDDADFGYLTSDRPGKGNDDIYRFSFKRLENPLAKAAVTPLEKPLIKTPAPAIEKYRELYVFDKSSMKPIPGVKISSCDNKIYSSNNDGKVNSISADLNNCEVTASSLGYADKKKILTGFSNYPIVRDTIWMEVLTNQKIVLHNIYYDFNKYDILPESAKELDHLVSLMKQNPAMSIQLSSHTDSRGSDAYNQQLSELRAKSAADYLIVKGIEKERISWKGYGKSQLINKCIEPCTPAQQRENRRTELYIPQFIRGEAVTQTKGDYSNQEKHENSFKAPIPIKKESVNEVGKSETTPVKNEVKVIEDQNPTFKYFIILGSFTAEINARSFLSQLENEGYKARILSGTNQPVRVGIGFNSLTLTLKSLQDIRTKYKGAWIYKNV